MIFQLHFEGSWSWTLNNAVIAMVHGLSGLLWFMVPLRQKVAYFTKYFVCSPSVGLQCPSRSLWCLECHQTKLFNPHFRIWFQSSNSASFRLLQLLGAWSVVFVWFHFYFCSHDRSVFFSSPLTVRCAQEYISIWHQREKSMKPKTDKHRHNGDGNKHHHLRDYHCNQMRFQQHKADSDAS